MSLLISPEYKAQLNALHMGNPTWGTTGRKHAPMVEQIIRQFGPQNVLDYGCGKQTLARALTRYRIIGYDPGVPGMDARPDPVDMVCCIDVLEHIEPEMIDDVLDDLQRITKMVGYFLICTVPAKTNLPDGRNAHLLVRPYRWWLNKLLERFEVGSMMQENTGMTVIVHPLKPKGNGHG